MRIRTQGVMFCLALAAFSGAATAQNQGSAPAPRQGVDQRPPSVFQKLGKDTGGPAPKRDLTGVWAGPFGERVGTPMVIPPLTPLGEQLHKLNVPDTGSVSIADTNDPWKQYCDPLGMPRAILTEQRAYAFAPMADRVIELIQYEHTWREIYTDGRELPKNVGAKGGPDPKYYGYSTRSPSTSRRPTSGFLRSNGRNNCACLRKSFSTSRSSACRRRTRQLRSRRG
jgi:hypothetical protein